MRRRSFATVVIGRNSLRKDGLAEFLRSADFGIVSSVTRADDLCAGKIQKRELLFLIVHTGDDFDAAVEQIELLRSRYPHGRVATFERMAEAEPNQSLKADLERQASAYRRLAAQRARRLGLPLPSEPERHSARGGRHNI